MNEYIEPGSVESDRREVINAAHSKMFSTLAGGPGNMAAGVLRFMLAFEQFPVPLGDRITPEDFVLAEKLMQEEISEMAQGFDKLRKSYSTENLVEFADGAIDTIYVIIWSMLKFNLPVNKLFSEVQRSNIAKLNPDGSYTKNEHGKVVKPLTWTPPDLQSIIVDHFDTAVWNGNIRSHSNE